MTDALGVILTGVAGVLIAIGGVLDRTRFSRAGAKELRATTKRLARQVVVAFAHIHRLEGILAAAGLKVPRRPKELDPDWGYEQDDDGVDEQEAVKRG